MYQIHQQVPVSPTLHNKVVEQVGVGSTQENKIQRVQEEHSDWVPIKLLPTTDMMLGQVAVAGTEVVQAIQIRQPAM